MPSPSRREATSSRSGVEPRRPSASARSRTPASAARSRGDLSVDQRGQLVAAPAVGVEHVDLGVAPVAVGPREAHQVGGLQRQPTAPDDLGVRLESAVGVAQPRAGDGSRTAHRPQQDVDAVVQRLDHQAVVALRVALARAARPRGSRPRAALDSRAPGVCALVGDGVGHGAVVERAASPRPRRRGSRGGRRRRAGRPARGGWRARHAGRRSAAAGRRRGPGPPRAAG